MLVSNRWLLMSGRLWQRADWRDRLLHWDDRRLLQRRLHCLHIGMEHSRGHKGGRRQGWFVDGIQGDVRECNLGRLLFPLLMSRGAWGEQ